MLRIVNRYLILYCSLLLLTIISCDKSKRDDYLNYRSSLNNRLEKDLDFRSGRSQASLKSTVMMRGNKPSEVQLLKDLKEFELLYDQDDRPNVDLIDSSLNKQFGKYYKEYRDRISLELMSEGKDLDSSAYGIIRKLVRLKILTTYYLTQVGASNFCFDVIDEFVGINIKNPCALDTVIIQKYPAINFGGCSGFPYAEIEFDGKALDKNNLDYEIIIPPNKHKLGWNHWSANLHVYEKYTDTIIPISGSYYVK